MTESVNTDRWIVKQRRHERLSATRQQSKSDTSCTLLLGPEELTTTVRVVI